MRSVVLDFLIYKFESGVLLNYTLKTLSTMPLGGPGAKVMLPNVCINLTNLHQASSVEIPYQYL